MNHNTILAAAASTLLLAATGPSTNYTVAADPIAEATVKDLPAHVLLTADSLSFPILSPEYAARIGLKPSIFKPQARVGSTKLKGKTSTARITLDGVTLKRRVLWFEQPLEAGYDMVMGPEAIPQDRVTFTINPAQPGRIVEHKYPLVHWKARTGTTIQIGTTELFVQWDLRTERTLLSAAAASTLAEVFHAQLTGAPQQRTLSFGIARPVRTMILADPFTIGAAALTSFDVRVSDYGSVSEIDDADIDPSEIVVTAGQKNSKALRIVTLGRDALRDCYSLTFDKRAKQITVACAT